MQIRPFELDELRFAWCNRIYLRTRTHWRNPIPKLSALTNEVLADLLEPYQLHVLETATNDIEACFLLSLNPRESAATAVSKTKGRISKWLNIDSELSSPKTLSRGYFACTIGKATAQAVDAYLRNQSEHDGYADRPNPPVFLRSFQHNDIIQKTVQTDHAVSSLRYHVVLASWFRQGVFDAIAAESVSKVWIERQRANRFLLEKVSFLPDHVHVAISIHPSQSPSAVVLELMNAAQERMWREFAHLVIRAKAERLWQASAYIGSFGDLTSNAVSGYLKRWSLKNRECAQRFVATDLSTKPKEPSGEPMGFFCQSRWLASPGIAVCL